MASEATKALPLVEADDVSSFVRTTALGIGRLVRVEATSARVRYFRSPGSSPYVDHDHPRSDVVVAALPTHTRAYLYDGRRWRIGRVDGVHPQDSAKYLIAFPNGEGSVLPIDAFDVRWQLPIDDPFEVLASVGGDSPLVYDARLTLLGEWSRQRAAALGVEGLLLGSVELHPHQLTIVRRVAEDSVKRYLLADEVGLGKTIEAGALIWQFLASQPDARVLVLTPDHLRGQWAAELLDKFRIDHYRSAWLRIRSHTDARSWPQESVDLLVIDEAHHVTRAGTLPENLRTRVVELAHGAEAVLLLSATPVRSNEAAFLDLLHLLDPAHYHPDDLPAFVRRVELRDRLALTHQALVPDIDEFDLSLYAEELSSLFPDDAMLAALVSEATASDEGARPQAVARVREHLSETYRLHHRLLRTRRSPELGSTFQVRGRKRGVPFTIDVADESDGLRRELLDSLRIHLSAAVEQGDVTPNEAVDLFRDVAERCGSLSHALMPIVEHDGQPPAGLVRRLTELIDGDVLRGWEALIREVHDFHPTVVPSLAVAISLATLSRGVRRAVVASAYAASAEAAAAEVARRWGHHRVALHVESQSREDNSAAIARWESEGPCSLLFCDASAEEGINLQNADTLIHIDLPWEAFRIEQRIGRCDRHARAFIDPIPSIVVMYGDQPYALGWFEFIADGCGVFNRSVSSLQYVLADTERDVQSRVLSAGSEALGDSVPGQAETLATEQTKIAAHDALDAIDLAESTGGASADHELISSDQRGALSGSLVTWLEGVGSSLRREGPGTIRIQRKPRPQIPFGLELAMAPSVDTALALNRRDAVSHSMPILRAGHPLVDALAAHLRHDDRGVAFAFLRPVRGQWPPVLIIRSDFLVAASVNERFLDEAERAGVRSWTEQLIEDAMPPIVETIMMRGDGVEVTHPALLQPYNKQRGDRNLSSRPAEFERLTEHVDWPALCAGALPLSRGLLAKRPSVATRPTSAAEYIRREVSRRADRQKSRELAGLDADVDLTLLASAVPQRVDPSVEILGCGVLFLADADKLRLHP